MVQDLAKAICTAGLSNGHDSLLFVSSKVEFHVISHSIGALSPMYVKGNEMSAINVMQLVSANPQSP